jgi:hypothetical protein
VFAICMVAWLIILSVPHFKTEESFKSQLTGNGSRRRKRGAARRHS